MAGGGAIPIRQSSFDEAGEVMKPADPNDRAPKVTLIGISIGMLGVQFSWSVQIGYVTKALLELGVSRQYVALAWLAGPIAGIIMQPLVGWYSDRTVTRFGRRRPYIAVGIALAITMMIVFGYGNLIGRALGDSDGNHSRGIAVSIISFWCLDFSINAAQGPLRTLLVDLAPPAQQAEGNTYLALGTSMGNFLGSLLGSLNLLKIFPFFPDDVAAIYTVGSVVLFCTTVVSLLTCHENQSTPEEIEKMNETTSKGGMNVLLQACVEAPPTYWRVYMINCFTWFAWFCVFVYGTSWVGAEVAGGSESAPEGSELRALYDQGVRMGNLGFSLQSVVAILYSLILNFLLERFGKLGPYIFSQVIQAVVLLATFFVRRAVTAIVLFASLGVCWANSMAVPWAIVGELTGRNTPEFAGMYITIFNSSQAFPEVAVSLVTQWVLRYTGSQTAVLVLGGIMATGGAIALCVSPLDLPMMDPYF